ncbi:MAG: NUDIX hydrolase [Beijerinckiaceae bacterium]
MTDGAITFAFVDEIESAYHERAWTFAQERAEEIDSNWRKLCAQRPGVFDGRVLVTDRWAIEERADKRVLVTRHFATNFRNFVAMRDWNFPDPQVRNCFAAAALMSREGHWVLGEMGGHTANAGRVYFPCGTPDMDDVKGSRVDLAGSVLRELEEETGIGPREVSVDPGWTIVFESGRIACLKIVRSPLATHELVARVRGFLASEKDAELSGVHVVRSRADLRPGEMPPFIVAFLERQPAG